MVRKCQAEPCRKALIITMLQEKTRLNFRKQRGIDKYRFIWCDHEKLRYSNRKMRLKCRLKILLAFVKHGTPMATANRSTQKFIDLIEPSLVIGSCYCKSLRRNQMMQIERRKKNIIMFFVLTLLMLLIRLNCKSNEKRKSYIMNKILRLTVFCACHVNFDDKRQRELSIYVQMSPQGIVNILFDRSCHCNGFPVSLLYVFTAKLFPQYFVSTGWCP